MADYRDIIAFSCDGEKILGVVVEHYTNPLDDFYIVYADYALHKSHNLDENSVLVIDNVIIPACDAALADYRLKRQHLCDLNRARKEISSIIEAIRSNMETDTLFADDDI